VVERFGSAKTLEGLSDSALIVEYAVPDE